MLRRFGFAGALFFLLLTAGIYLLSGRLNCLTLTLSPAFFFPALIHPPVLSPVYRLLNFVSHLIGTVISSLFLSLFFLLVLSSVRAAYSLLGKRFLPPGPDMKQGSYWIDMSLEEQDDMEKQY